MSYHPDGYAWGWLVNPGGVNSVTRTKFTVGLIPGGFACGAAHIPMALVTFHDSQASNESRHRSLRSVGSTKAPYWLYFLRSTDGM